MRCPACTAAARRTSVAQVQAAQSALASHRLPSTAARAGPAASCAAAPPPPSCPLSARDSAAAVTSWPHSPGPMRLASPRLNPSRVAGPSSASCQGSGPVPVWLACGDRLPAAAAAPPACGVPEQPGGQHVPAARSRRCTWVHNALSVAGLWSCRRCSRRCCCSARCAVMPCSRDERKGSVVSSN